MGGLGIDLAREPVVAVAEASVLVRFIHKVVVVVDETLGFFAKPPIAQHSSLQLMTRLITAFVATNCHCSNLLPLYHLLL